jgi:hypothetical protein
MTATRELVVAMPIDACMSPTKPQLIYHGKVVLAFRGGCPFYEKALNIMKGSQGLAAAIIIADNVDSEAGLITLVRGGKTKKHEVR